jgi:chromosome segregation protein
MRIRELEGESVRLQEASAMARAERIRIEERVPILEAAMDDARRRLVEAQEAQTLRVATLRSCETEWNRVRHELEELHRKQEAARLRRVEAQTRLEGYEAQLTGTYAVNYEGAVSELADLAEDGAADIETVRERLAHRRGKLQDLGPVNVMAIDEHRELEERLRFLTTQEEDLTQSIASLRAIIAKINKTTKQLFLDTFQELQTKFNDVFRNFFEGGRAELVLVEDEESAEPGVEIVAQPPGKRLKNIAMLSGGERALTAMSLIFASFLIRPTPFCVLDEIDAPLDEENTLRFTRVLRDLSRNCQFIVITHSKQTMEAADSLYGVTMEEAGISALMSVRMNPLLEHA